MSWRDLAKRHRDTEDNGDDRDKSSPEAPNVPIVPNAPPLDPSRAMKTAHAGLASLEPGVPKHGFSEANWRRLLEDASWLLEGFGQTAFRDGWTLGELFGLWWWHDGDALVVKEGWGGIADRLQGARSLKMTADRAHWRRMFSGEPDQFNRTAYPNLKPLWEPGQ